MKNDKLKDFVDQNRLEFETELEQNIWENIAQKLDRKELDSLKNFVEKNRTKFENEFDLEFASTEIWAKVDQNLPKKQTIFYQIGQMAWKIAAVLVLVCGLAWFGFNLTQSEQSVADKHLQKIAPELVEAEKYYSALIKQKMQVIQAKKEQQGQQIFADLEMLDSAYAVLRMDLEDGVASEEVINAMIQNHRIKLEILENILEEIQDGENEKNQTEQL